MLGRSVLLNKKWWVLALLVTLALSLTSCGKKKASSGLQSGSNLFACDGNDWSFDVEIVPQNSFYYLRITPVSLNQEGDVSQINIARQDGTNVDVDVLKNYTAMYSDRPIVVGPLDYDKFDGSWNLILWQYSYNGITNLLDFFRTSGGKATSCELSFE